MPYELTKTGIPDKKTLDNETEHYLLDDPYLTSIDLAKLANTVQQADLSPKVMQKALAGESDNRDIVKVGEETYLVQYEPDKISVLNTTGKELTGPLPDEILELLRNQIKASESKRTSFIAGVNNRDLPNITMDGYAKILKGLTPAERTATVRDRSYYLMMEPNGLVLFDINGDLPSSATNPSIRRTYTYSPDEQGDIRRYGSIPVQQMQNAWRDFFQNVLPPLTQRGIEILVSNSNFTSEVKGERIDTADIRLTPDNPYKIVPTEGVIYLLNKQDKALSKKLNLSSGNLLNAGNISQANYNRLMGAATPEPTATTQTPAAGALPAVSQGGDVNLQQVFIDNGLSWTALPDRIQRKLAQGGTAKNIRADRGTDTRNESLGDRGRITAAYQLAGTASALYIATLNSGQVIGIIASQPGNVHGFVTGARYYQYSSATDLRARLELNNINENNSMTNKTHLLRKLVEKLVKEAQPAVAPPDTDKDREVADPITKPKTPPSPFEHDDEQEVNSPAKARKVGTSDKTAEIEKKIIDRYKSRM